MTASLEGIQRLLQQIRDELPLLVQSSQISPSQIVVGEGLSDIDRRMGLLQAGEFRTGNGVEPGLGFTGVRIGYPAFSYSSSLWHIVGVNDDVLQFGLRASDGAAISGAGAVTIDASGITINAGLAEQNQLKWATTADPTHEAYVSVNESGDMDIVILNDSSEETSLELISQSGAKVATIELTALKATESDIFMSADDIDITGTNTIFLNATTAIKLFGPVVINENGLDQDVRVESDGDANNWFSDGGTNRIGVGTGTPGYKLDVAGDINISSGSVFRVNGTAVLSGGAGAETNANDIFNVVNPGGVSAFAGTIATLPGGAVLTYNVTSGQEGAMVPTSTSQLAKMRLYNTTRGTSALISNCVVGTNTITLTANVPAGWATTDVITIASQTVSGGTLSWVDLEITSGPTGKSNLFVNVQVASATVGDAMRLHPFEASFSTSKYVAANVLEANQTTNGFGLQKVTTNVFSLAWTGTPSAVVIREAGYLS